MNEQYFKKNKWADNMLASLVIRETELEQDA